MKIPEVPCKTCCTPTTFTGTRHCNDCHEVELRLGGYLQRGGPRAYDFVANALAQEQASARTRPPVYGPYNYCFYEVKDAVDALGFLQDWWEKGYEYVEGLPAFRADTTQTTPLAGTIVHVLFKLRRAPK